MKTPKLIEVKTHYKKIKDKIVKIKRHVRTSPDDTPDNNLSQRSDISSKEWEDMRSQSKMTREGKWIVGGIILLMLAILGWNYL